MDFIEIILWKIMRILLFYILLTTHLLLVILGAPASAQQETNEFYSKFSEEEALSIYRSIYDILPGPSKETMSLLIALMEKGELPVFLPRQNTAKSYYSRPLQINPFSVRAFEAERANTNTACENSNISWIDLEKKEWVGDCIKTHTCPSGDITGVIIGDARNNTIACRNGNRLYWMGSGNNTIKSSYGNDIIETGSGNDIIETGYGSDIIIFRKNWGQDVVKSKCVFSSLNPDELPAGRERDLWLTRGYASSNFVIFGPGIFPEDLQWQPEQNRLVKILQNIKTGDQISFQPSACFNFVFYEGGTIESHYNYTQRIQREAKTKEAERIKTLNLPEKYKKRLQNCFIKQGYMCYTEIVDKVHEHITNFGQQCAIIALIGKTHADHGNIPLARSSLSFITQNASPNIETSQKISNVKKCSSAALNAFIISLAKAGEVELAQEASDFSSGNTVTKTLIAEEIVRNLIQKNRPRDALHYAAKYLYDNNASRENAVEYEVTSQNFYSLLASLDYEAFIKNHVTKGIDRIDVDTKETSRIMRLLLIVAFDKNNYQRYDEFLPDNLSPENLATFYFSTGHQMFLNGRDATGEYFYNKAIQAMRNIEDGRKRQQLASTFFYFSFGFLGDNTLAEKLAEFFSADTTIYISASLLATGLNRIKKGHIIEAKHFHEKAGVLLGVILQQPSKQNDPPPHSMVSFFNTENITRWHEKLTKELTVKMLDTSPQETALQFYQNSSKTNNLLTTAKYQDLLARLLLKREHPEQALQTALLIADIDIRRGVLWAIANHASIKGNHTLNLNTINELIPTIKQSSEKVRQRILQKPEASAGKNVRNYPLARRLVTLTEETRHNSLYQKIITRQIENGDIDEAKRTIALLKGNEEIKKSQQKINDAIKKEEMQSKLPSYTENKEILKKILELRRTDRTKAEQFIFTIKDPYYFAKAILLLAE